MGLLKKLLLCTTQGPFSSAPASATDHPAGLNVVSDGSSPIVDIVAVHGLNGHREHTWTAENGVYWLRDLLRIDIPEARIMSWGYDAASDTQSSFPHDHARTLVSDLTRKRSLTQSSERPIIFIAHSLGGILLKSALIHSDAARQGPLLEQRSIKLSTYGIVFMGTPHQGWNIQLDHRFKHLKRDSPWLQQQMGSYSSINGEFVTKYAYEEYLTPIASGKQILLVPRASAVVPGHADAESIAIPANHGNMVKFPSKQNVGYKTILEILQIMLMDATSVIESRWRVERRLDKVILGQPPPYTY